MEKHHFKKYFTLDEARSYLPELRKKLPEIQELYQLLNGLGFDVYTGRYKTGFNPDTLEPYPYQYRRFLSLINQLLDSGIQIKSIEEGLIDFPAIRVNGEEVFLCWKLEEQDILFWHRMNEGFRGRQPIGTF